MGEEEAARELLEQTLVSPMSWIRTLWGHQDLTDETLLGGQPAVTRGPGS